MWSPYVEGISPSSLQKFMFCRERFRLYMLERLREERPFSKAIAYGSMMHAGLEAYCCSGRPDVKTDNPSKLHYLKAIDKEAEKIGNRFQTRRSEIDLHREFARGQIKEYVNRFWTRDCDRKYTEVESNFAVATTLQDGSKRQPVVKGIIDAVFFAGGKPYIEDHKCRGNIDEQYLSDGMVRDLQIMLYCWAYWVREGRKKTAVPNIFYNLIRRPLSQRPFRQKKAESLSAFISRVIEDIRNDPKHYFLGREYAITQKDLEDFEFRCLEPLLIQLCDWYDSIQDCPMDPWQSPLHFESPLVYGGAPKTSDTDYFRLLTTGSRLGTFHEPARGEDPLISQETQ